MRKPTDEEQRKTFACPGCSLHISPDGVWESHLPDGKKVKYATIEKHDIPRLGIECDHSGHIVVI